MDTANAVVKERVKAELGAAKETAIADLEGLLATPVTNSLNDAEKALINDAESLEEVDAAKAKIIDDRSEVYTLKFTQDGEEDYRITKALHPGEARAVFQNAIREEGLEVAFLYYDDESNTFTSFNEDKVLESLKDATN